MALILNMDTATAVGSVCLSQDGEPVTYRVYENQRAHAAQMAPAIQSILEEVSLKGTQIDAIAISGGPGSYTGLRVASSTAKGLCFSWGIPLIAISTLKMMANGILEEEPGRFENTLLCPMIDARRKEVFTAMYDDPLKELEKPQAAVLDESDFLTRYRQRRILFFGTGAEKAEKILQPNENWQFNFDYQCHASHLASLSETAFQNKDFVDVAYFDPFYLKSVYIR